MLLSALVTVPVPVPLSMTVRVRFGRLKVAVTSRSESIVRRQSPEDSTFGQLDQPATLGPGSGRAASVTPKPFGQTAEHVVPHEMFVNGALTTLPVPEPSLATVIVRGMPAQLAVAAIVCPGTVTVHVVSGQDPE